MASHKNFKREIPLVPDATKKKVNARSFEETKVDWRKYCSFWRQYPDRFMDFIRDDNKCKIKLHFYQRIMLRVLFRHKKVYFTFTRGTAKSYTQILALYLKCMFYSGTELFICAPNKEQAAKISRGNIEKIWEHFPVLRNEVKKVEFQKDYTRLTFQNGSKLDVVQVADAERGGRRNGGSIEEIVDPKMKKDTLHSVVIPLMANDRLAVCGGVDEKGEIHKFQWYITTSGTRQSFAFEKMKEILAEMAQGKSAFCLGSSYELPCMHGQLTLSDIQDLKVQPSYNPLNFAREYESVWTGTSDNSLVQLDDLLACRVLSKAEFKHSGEKNVEYVLAYDVARAESKQSADCALVVIKITPRGDGTYQKHLVNIFSFKGTHFNEQAIFIKKKVNEYKARIVVVDANGAGKGLVDVLVTECDENPAYSVVNDDSYDKYKTENSKPLLYALQSNTKEDKASYIHDVFIGMITGHKVKILHSETSASTTISKKEAMDSEALAEKLYPFALADLMCEEIMNLEYKMGGNQTQVKQISRSINKDKFSAFEYGLYYIYTLEQANTIRKKETFDAKDFMVVRTPVSRLKR